MTHFTTISMDHLGAVTGGAGAGSAALAVGKGVLKKAGPVATVASAGYAGYQGYSAERARGGSVTSGLKEGALEAASDATFGLTNWALGRP